jgi:hypothetical protein
MEENESESQQYTLPDDEPKMEFKAAGDGSYHLTLKMKCYPDGAGGWVCY